MVGHNIILNPSGEEGFDSSRSQQTPVAWTWQWTLEIILAGAHCSLQRHDQVSRLDPRSQGTLSLGRRNWASKTGKTGPQSGGELHQLSYGLSEDGPWALGRTVLNWANNMDHFPPVSSSSP